MSTTKKCNRCQKDLELTSFKKWKNGKYLSSCILCNKRKVLSKKKLLKMCKVCLVEKPYEQYKKTKKSYALNCLECAKNCDLNNIKKRKIRKQLRKEEYKNFIMNENLILCSRCNKKKNIDSFRKRKNGQYYKQCIECNKICAKNKIINRKKKENQNDSDISEDKKKCFKCFKVKLLTEFKKNKDTYTKYCSACLEENLNRNLKRKKDESQSKDNKKCVRCFIIKPLSCYKTTKKGIQKQCEECCEHYKKIQKKRKTELLIDKDKLKDNEKQCTRCFKVKITTDFKSKNHKHCIECNNNHSEYLIKNRCEHGCLNKSACVKCFGGSICEHNKKKSECKECDFHGYLYQKVRSRLGSAIRKGSKTKRTMEYLGCDINIFRKHIEEKFVEGMNWENYGKAWHIDHIVPINYKNPTLDEVIERLHYSNTQPLWASENISKGNRYIG